MFVSRRFWLGFAVTGAFLVALFWRVDFGDLGTAFREANYAYVVPGIAVYFVSLYFRAFRWRSLLRPVRAISTHRLYPVVAVGYMANNLLPMRLGEVVRSYYLARREPVRASTALGTIVAERVFDGVTLLFLLAIATLFLPATGLTERVSDAVHLPVPAVIAVLVVPFAVALAVMVGAALRPGAVRGVVAFFTRRLPGNVATLADSLTQRFIDGFQGLHQPRRLGTILLLSLPVWLVEGTMYYLIALGFNLDVYFETVWQMMAAILMVTAMANLATSLPSSQGSVGPFEFFAVLTLESLGVGTALASAYAVVLHVALLLPVIGVGLLYVATGSVSLGQLTKGEPTDATPVAEEVP